MRPHKFRELKPRPIGWGEQPAQLIFTFLWPSARSLLHHTKTKYHQLLFEDRNRQLTYNTKRQDGEPPPMFCACELPFNHHHDSIFPVVDATQHTQFLELAEHAPANPWP